MPSAKLSARPLPALPWGSLPVRMRLLHVAPQEGIGECLAESFGADSATSVELETVTCATAAAQRLQAETFDAVLVRHQPPRLDAPGFVAAIRAGGAELPTVVLGTAAAVEMEACCYESGADAYLSLAATNTRSLLWTLARAVERHALLRENRRLRQFEQRRLSAEHQEAERLLTQQRNLIRDLETLRGSEDGDGQALAATATEMELATPSVGIGPVVHAANELTGLDLGFDSQYRELLRAYVMMGSGNLTGALAELAESLAAANVAARCAMQWHVQAVEDLVRGLGQRSSRHVMGRADLLLLELMTHLVESYRTRGHNARQAA